MQGAEGDYIEVEAPLNTDILSEAALNNGCTSVHTSLEMVFVSEENDTEDKDEVPENSGDEPVKSSQEKSSHSRLAESDANSIKAEEKANVDDKESMLLGTARKGTENVEPYNLFSMYFTICYMLRLFFAQ